jgi:hypothetical protein
MSYKCGYVDKEESQNFIHFGIFNLGSLGFIVSIKLCILTLIIYKRKEIVLLNKGRHGRHRIVVGYMTTYVISAYHD